MRFLLYNIAYGTGYTKGVCHSVFTLHRYVLSARHHFQGLCSFIGDCRPDVVGLVEVDSGSMRANHCNQVAEIARLLTHDHHFHSKYGLNSFTRFVPILRHQGNALFARQTAWQGKNHFFPVGFKRLVVEAEIDGVRFLLVHLALRRRIRARQLSVLSKIIGARRQPVIVAGDFNTMSGPDELCELLKATGLTSANLSHRCTYPSYAPRKELDFVLCSSEITVNEFRVLQDVKLSDHLPLLLDFSLM